MYRMFQVQMRLAVLRGVPPRHHDEDAARGVGQSGADVGFDSSRLRRPISEASSRVFAREVSSRAYTSVSPTRLRPALGCSWYLTCWCFAARLRPAPHACSLTRLRLVIGVLAHEASTRDLCSWARLRRVFYVMDEATSRFPFRGWTMPMREHKEQELRQLIATASGTTAAPFAYNRSSCACHGFPFPHQRCL